MLRTVKQHPPVQHDASAVRLYDARDAPQCHAFTAAGSAQQSGGGVAGGKGSTEGKAVQLFFNVDFKAHFRAPAFCFFLQQVHSQQHHRRDDDIHQHPPHSTQFIVGAPQLVDCGGDGGSLAGGVARDHAGSAVFAQCPGKGQHRARQNALTAGGHPHPPEDPCIGLSQRLRRPRQRFVKAFKCAARGAVHQRKCHHDGGKDGAVPVHDQLYPEMLHEKDAQRPLCAEEQQQKVAHHRGRQHHGQGEQHIQHTLDRPRQTGDIVGCKNAKKEHRHAADQSNAQAVPQRIPVHVCSFIRR